MRLLLFAILVSTAALAQTVDELKSKYGTPVSETFAVRPGIAARVNFGRSGAIVEMLIFPIRPDSLIESRSMTFSDETARNVLDELVPMSRRGKFVIGGFVNGICLPENDCAGSGESYENLSIFFNSAAKTGQLCYVDIRFKK